MRAWRNRLTNYKLEDKECWMVEGNGIRISGTVRFPESSRANLFIFVQTQQQTKSSNSFVNIRQDMNRDTIAMTSINPFSLLIWFFGQTIQQTWTTHSHLFSIHLTLLLDEWKGIRFLESLLRNVCLFLDWKALEKMRGKEAKRASNKNSMQKANHSSNFMALNVRKR